MVVPSSLQVIVKSPAWVAVYVHVVPLEVIVPPPEVSHTGLGIVIGFPLPSFPVAVNTC